MPRVSQSAITKHRRRMKRQGVLRLEVQVRKEDAPLVRSVVSALGDPEREAETRALLRERFGPPPAVSLKQLLASAPLEGIKLERARDTGRPVDL